MRVGIVDYGSSNTLSISNAFTRLGADVFISNVAAELKTATHLILPGVGAAGLAMQNLQHAGLVEWIRSCEIPLLGICLGMQLLFEYSEEDDTETIGIIPGEVRKNRSAPRRTHIGWNEIRELKGSLFQGIDEGATTYFVHSYSAFTSESRSAVTRYGEEFCAAIEHKNMFGVQFHPEKSSIVGDKILTNFLNVREKDV